MLASGAKAKNSVATHALVFLLAGITTRWKQTIAYEFTGTSYDAAHANQIIQDIIVKYNTIGLHICTVISDMGPQNQAPWGLNGIVCSRHAKTQNFTKHPGTNGNTLYYMPDTPHVFKNTYALSPD